MVHEITLISKSRRCMYLRKKTKCIVNPYECCDGRYRIQCHVAISVFNQSRPGQRINSLHVIETDAAYRNPRFRSIPLDNYQGWGSRKRNYLLRDVQIITKENM